MSKKAHLNTWLAAWLFLIAVGVSARASGQTITPSPYWKNRIEFPDDSFRYDQEGVYPPLPGWIKFTILLSDPTTVYFQDSPEYMFHYDFASELLDPFVSMSPAEYDHVTLYEQGQQAVLGAVIMPPIQYGALPTQEYGIQFVRKDPYPREMIRDMFNAVETGIFIFTDSGVEAFYFPTYEQLTTADANRDWFESEGIPVSSSARWAEGNACYSEGWALGDLKFFAGDQIEVAHQSGDLLPGDILLTDGVPAEVPFVAGIITLSPATPNSHVAILSNTYGVPFVHLAIAEDAERAQQLVGHRIAFRTYKEYEGADVRLIDTENVLTDQQVEEILVLKEPPELDIQPVAHYGAYSTSTDGLLLSDIQYFGGKAANFGMLRAAIPDNSPVAIAFSFDLWNAFLDQQLDGGNTLRVEINSRLSGCTYPPSDMAALVATLEDIGDMFTDTDVTSFRPELRDAVIDTLTEPQYGSDINRKIRFRSSTNVEDSERFTGAGLYSSYSGCLADDLDSDDEGPCACDPTRAEERGVFRAIRRVFASFYNQNAFLERLRHGVNEHDVGMALLVHHSFPDDIELANGVATVEKHPAYTYIKGVELVSQCGAVSVTNPEPGSIPEEVRVDISFSGRITAYLHRPSNLVPLGGTVMDWKDDYIELGQLLVAAAEEFEQVTGKTQYTLDFEYKKVAPDGELVVKQIREIPRPDSTPSITPFLINEPTEYCTYQGEYGDVFANHRLKSRVQVETKSLWLSPSNLKESFYAEVELEYAAHARVRTFSGELPLWPQADHTYADEVVTDTWAFSDLLNPRSYELTTTVLTLISRAESPLLVISDLGHLYWPGGLRFNADYAAPVPSLDSNWPPGPATRTTDAVCLYPCQESQSGDILQERQFEGQDGVSITTSFYWPPEPEGIVAGYTAPLARWVETVIGGYTTEPIVLHGYYSQSYAPEHHNFAEHFIFEPRLESGISQQILAELRAQDIRLIYVNTGLSPEDNIMTFGFEGEPEPEDVNGDGGVDAVDIQLVINAVLSLDIDNLDADINDDGMVDAVDVQLVINAVLGS